MWAEFFIYEHILYIPEAQYGQKLLTNPIIYAMCGAKWY
jgi:hypothetical protein